MIHIEFKRQKSEVMMTASEVTVMSQTYCDVTKFVFRDCDDNILVLFAEKKVGEKMKEELNNIFKEKEKENENQK